MTENEPSSPPETAEPTPPEPEDNSDLHILQRVMDNPWLLLLLGFVIPVLSYTVWGWIELMMMTEAKLP